MKRAIFLFVTVVSVVLSSYFLFCNKFNNEHSIQPNSKLYDEEINVPLNEWQKNLTGRWGFEATFVNSRSIQQFIGEKYYNLNGDFKTFVTYNLYRCRYEIAPNALPDMVPACLRVITGGSYTGTWHLDTINKKWVEKILVCNIGGGRADKDFKIPELCDEYFKPNNELAYGNVEDSISKLKIVTFTKDVIVAKGHFYNTGKDYLLTLTRKKSDD